MIWQIKFSSKASLRKYTSSVEHSVTHPLFGHCPWGNNCLKCSLNRSFPVMLDVVTFPTFFSRVGPLIRHWTMRYEAKHQYFKHLASTMGNYINICYSLAMRHQCLQSYLHASGAIIHTDDQEVGNGMFIDKICSSSHMNYGYLYNRLQGQIQGVSDGLRSIMV